MFPHLHLAELWSVNLRILVCASYKVLKELYLWMSLFLNLVSIISSLFLISSKRIFQVSVKTKARALCKNYWFSAYCFCFCKKYYSLSKFWQHRFLPKGRFYLRPSSSILLRNSNSKSPPGTHATMAPGTHATMAPGPRFFAAPAYSPRVAPAAAPSAHELQAHLPAASARRRCLAPAAPAHRHRPAPAVPLPGPNASSSPRPAPPRPGPSASSPRPHRLLVSAQAAARCAPPWPEDPGCNKINKEDH